MASPPLGHGVYKPLVEYEISSLNLCLLHLSAFSGYHSALRDYGSADIVGGTSLMRESWGDFQLRAL